MTPTSSIDKIERQTLIRAPRSRVWKALTDIQEFCRWFSASTEESSFEPGKHVRMVSTYPGPYQGMSFAVDIADMLPEHTFSWRWHPGAKQAGEDVSAEPMTLVVFRLQDAEGGTLVTVTETGFSRLFQHRVDRALRDNTSGWEKQMAALERHFSDGR